MSAIAVEVDSEWTAWIERLLGANPESYQPRLGTCGCKGMDSNRPIVYGAGITCPWCNRVATEEKLAEWYADMAAGRTNCR